METVTIFSALFWHAVYESEIEFFYKKKTWGTFMFSINYYEGINI